MRNHKKLKRSSAIGNRLACGIAVTTVLAASLQKMINVDYIAEVELAWSEFSSKSKEIFDLTKLIVHRMLFKKFENDTFRMLGGSSPDLSTREQRGVDRHGTPAARGCLQPAAGVPENQGAA